MIPAGGGICLNLGPAGINFSSGIAISCTGAIADNDTTAISASQVVINLKYD
jgi:hypothetical protein